MNFRNLVTRLAAAMAFSLFLGEAALAQAPIPPPPPFPVGHLAAFPTIVQTGIKPTLQWSVDLPANVDPADYVYFIRQEQRPSGSFWDMPVARAGETMAHLSIDPGSAVFELWAVGGSPVRDYLLDATVIGSYLPVASLTFRSEDPYPILPRTRADRPFHVDVTVAGIISDVSAPPQSKGVTLTRHVQSYGATGTGADLNREQATFLSQSSITTNGTSTTTFVLNSIPGADRAKVRGEERFMIFSQPGEAADPESGFGYTLPQSVIASRIIQIWPVADGAITGITQGQAIDAVMPDVTFQLDDLYPSSTTYAQVYKGSPQLGTTGTIVPGSRIMLNDSVPANRVLTLSNYSPVVDSDGLWTMELLTVTPFGIDRLAHVSFTVQDLGMTNDFLAADLDASGSLTLTEFTTTLDPGLAARIVLKQFKGADRDRDNGITLDEYLVFTGVIPAPTKVQEQFDDADDDADEALSFDEFKATIHGNRPLMLIRKIFLRADGDANGAISLEEWESYRDGTWARVEAMSKFDLADLDGDGELTVDEFATTKPRVLPSEKVQRVFNKLDRDDNGVLTRLEWKAGTSADW